MKISAHEAGLVRRVFSWTLKDIFNEELYANMVEKIPESFQSIEHYLNSYIYPLLEETRAELCSSMEVISNAPFTEVISLKFKKSDPYGYYFYEVDVDSWRNRTGSRGKDPYKPKPGDVYVLSNQVPETVSDLDRYGWTWNFALVTYIPEDELKKEKKESGVMNDDNDASLEHFIFKTSHAMKAEEGMSDSLFAIYLMNMMTNNRTWISLKKVGSMNILKEILCTDAKVYEESCSFCSSVCAGDISNMSLSALNDSQAACVRNCIFTMQCHHRTTVKLVWGPPGTGKTKTVSTMLFNLFKLKYRILACAPTNVAVTELSGRVLKLVQEYEGMDHGRGTSLCSLGDLLLFGNNDRLKVHEDLEEIYLDNRVSLLLEFLERSVWKQCIITLTDFLENCFAKYKIHLENESKKKTENVAESETEDHSFLTFTRRRYTSAALEVKRCVCTLGTHLSIGFLLEHTFRNMALVLNLLDTLECLLFRDGMLEEELKEVFAEKVPDNVSLCSTTPYICEEVKYNTPDFFYKIRSECVAVLRLLCQYLTDCNFPRRMDKQMIRDLCFQNASLFFCTASSSFKLHSLDIQPLDLVVIDEAAQLKESESTIPLQLTGVKHAFLIGDECQLPAMVHSKVSDDACFGRSLFERLGAAGHPKHLLNIQYRMHPDISRFPNSMFYCNNILDAPNVKSQGYGQHYLPGPMFGSYSFISIPNGKEEFDDVGHSRRNMVEAAVVMKIVQNLFKAWGKSRKKVTIGIVSPYAAQVATIEEMVRHKYEKTGNFVVKVKSIDGFQGGEEDIIILSTVRSNSGGAIGFLSNAQRTNVALTRARHSLWILGNGPTLVNSDSVWAKLVVDAKERKCFFNADEDTCLADVIIQVKKNLDQFEDLLNGNSIFFKSARWKILFSDNFRRSFGNLKSSHLKKSVINLLLKLSSGWRPKKRNVDCHCENSSQLVQQYKVGGLFLISTIDVVKEYTYSQVLKIWDIMPLEEIPKLLKRLDSIFLTYTDDIIRRCNQICITENLQVPMIWQPCANIVRYKNPSGSVTGSTDAGIDTSSVRSYVENSKVSESLLLMKFYSLSSGVVGHLLSTRDGTEVDLPFQVSEHEQEIIHFSRSTFILGRSGTGKTTVLTMKLIQREQQFSLSCEGLCDDNGAPKKNDITKNPQDYEVTALRQLFVTVSPKLCAAIKNHIFNLMRFTCRSFREMNTVDMYDFDDTTQFKGLPDSLVDITSNSYPLVVTFQKLLMMLDRSMENSYFDKFQDVRELSYGRSGQSNSIAFQMLIREKEVNFEKFDSLYWPRFNSQLTKMLDASTVFTEIISYIKGGLIAGRVFDGKMNREDYISLSCGRASSLSRYKRENIYDIFVDYEKKKIKNGHFDLADFVNDLHCRLRLGCFKGDMMDFVYIDEVQDLTMRQIALFKYICKNVDEGFVFSGDTAQTIAKGIDFRFQDIKSLFYNEFLMGVKTDSKPNIQGRGQHRISDIFHLNQNFRTHAGVLNLSQSVIELLYRYFPFSVDVLSPETSLVYGEAPVLLESGNGENAIVTIFGNAGPSGGNMIGFGSEQVILVRDDHTKKEIFEYVGKQALVLTILECKGLEFQDVLLYNFFGTSPMRNQWRIVYDYIKEQNILDGSEPRAFPRFDEAKHNMLCSELKQLYVAITRTRQRLWICENMEEFSKPMFDYWKKLCLVQTRQLDDSLAQAMQVASSKKEWSQRGTKLFNDGNFEMAMMCFERAGDKYREKWARAAGLRASSERLRGSHSYNADIALKQAAEIYEAIDKAEFAAKCFVELRDYERAGKIYLEKFGESKLEDAADCFSLAGCWSRAAKIYARGAHISKCLSTCKKGELFDMGLNFIKKWKIDANEGVYSSFKSLEIKKMEEDYLERCALHYHERKDPGTMMKYVKEFHSIDCMRKFLRSRNYLDCLLVLEEEYGNFIEAAKIAREKGDRLSEANLLAKGHCFEDAGDVFSLVRCLSDAAEVYAKGNCFSKCLSACTNGGLFDMGLNFIKVWRGNKYEDSNNMAVLSEVLEEVVQGFLEGSAVHYHEQRNSKTMMKFVREFSSIDLIRSFLRSLKYLHELMLLEEENGNFIEASNIAAERGDLLSEADLLVKVGQYEDASRLILVHVLGNSLWAAGSKGWPLKKFKNKEELLQKAKKFSMNGGECFLESVCLEVNLLSNEEGSLLDLRRFLSDSERLRNVRAEIICAWKILGEHFCLQPRSFDWHHEVFLNPLKQANDFILQNTVSMESMVYIWNLWRGQIITLLDHLQYLGKEHDKDCTSYVQFCLDYLGVREKAGDQQMFYIWISADANWLKNIDRMSLQRTEDLVFLDTKQLAVAAKGYWISEVFLVGTKVLSTLDALYKLSVQNSFPKSCQGTVILNMFQIAKQIMEFNDWKRGSSELQKLQNFIESSRRYFVDIAFPLDWRQSMTSSMVSLKGTRAFENLVQDVLKENIYSRSKLTYGKIGLIVSLLLVYGKLTVELHKKIASILHVNIPWNSFVGILNDALASKSALQQVSLSWHLKEALQNTFCANWREEADYISPPSFIYLVEHLLLLVSSCRRNFFTTKLSLTETLSIENWQRISSRYLMTVNAGETEEIYDFIASTLGQLLFNKNDTLAWLQKSRINAKQYYPLLVLRLTMLIGLVCVNSGRYLDLLSNLHGRNDIKSLLPSVFSESLFKMTDHDFGSVLAEALGTVQNPLVVVRYDIGFPGFNSSEALIMDLNTIQCREDILGVLFPKNLEEVQDRVKMEDLALNDSYKDFWNVVDSLRGNKCEEADDMEKTWNIPLIKLQLESCIRVLDAATSKNCQDSSGDCEEGSLSMETKSILNELRQLTIPSSVSNEEFYGTTIKRVGEAFEKLQASRARLHPWLDSMFLKGNRKTACQPPKASLVQAVESKSNKRNKKNKGKGRKRCN